MTSTRSAALTCAAVLVAAWLVAALVSRGVAGPSGPVPLPEVSPNVIDPLLAEMERQASGLQHRLAAAPAPATPARDPFRFVHPEDRHQTAARAPSSALPAPQEMPTPARSLPALRLIGIAEHRTEYGLKRVAILSGLDQVVLAGEGEEIDGMHRVHAVGAEAVELIDLRDGSTLRLGLN
jgi:hypothetical protein